jgi:hypothetical protein
MTRFIAVVAIAAFAAATSGCTALVAGAAGGGAGYYIGKGNDADSDVDKEEARQE